MPIPTTLLAAAAAAALISVAIETMGHPLRGVDRRVPVLAARLGILLALFLAWFSFAWRPLLAAAATVVTVAILRAISAKKRALVGEPLVFSDFALLGQAVRHPDLYYLDGRALLVVAAVALPVGLWIWAEPALLPSRSAPALAALVGLPILQIALARLVRRPAAAAAARLAPRPALVRDEARFGLLLTLLVYLSRWSDLRRGTVPAARAAPEARRLPGPRSVVVVQLESFVDPAVLAGGATGPGLRRARERALLWGALGVPGHGAYTMRSEFAVLSGLDPDEISFEGFDPYLSAGRERRFPTLASALRARGYATVFVHPFRRGFFGRDRVLPALGFDRLVMEEDFAGAERIGRHVSDGAVGRRILDELDRAAGPILVVAATMQNHGPWTAALSPDPGTPLARYRRHLDDADAMIAMLLDGMAARGVPALLCVYGDHPPILAEVGAPSETPATTYAIIPFGTDGAGERRDLSAAALGRALLAFSGGRSGDPHPEAGGGRRDDASTGRP